MYQYAHSYTALDRWFNRRLAPNADHVVVVLYFSKAGMIGDDAVTNELRAFHDRLAGVYGDQVIRMLVFPIRQMKLVQYIFRLRSYPTAIVMRRDLSETANFQLRQLMGEDYGWVQPDVGAFFARLEAEIVRVINDGIVDEHLPPPDFRARLTLVINVLEFMEDEPDPYLEPDPE